MELKTIKGIEEILKIFAFTNGENSKKHTHGKSKQTKVIMILIIFDIGHDLSKLDNFSLVTATQLAKNVIQRIIGKNNKK